MKSPRVISRIAALGLCVAISSAEVLHVPSDYPTIQSALNAVVANDSVLVEIGEYAEALIAPPLRFYLLGNVIPDTGDYARPVVDGSLLPDSLRDACLTLPVGSDAVIEDLTFRNRFAMPPFVEVGGVNCLADFATFRRCTLDSLLYGIKPPDQNAPVIVAENCLFREDSGAGIYMRGTLLATNCLFDGGWAWAGVECGPNSQIIGCTFCRKDRYLLITHGSGVTISDCVFGPSGEHGGFTPVHLTTFSGEVSHCIFSGIVLGSFVMQVEGNGIDSAIIRDNLFVSNHVTSIQGRSAVRLMYGCSPKNHLPLLIFRRNTVAQCTTDFSPKALGIWGCADVEENRFTDNHPQHRWAIEKWTPNPGIFVRNLIWANENGARTQAFGSLDARWNWWGDPTGPSHPTQNPAGLGDAVGDGVLFDPWSPDSNFVNSVGNGLVIPQTYSLSVYPNPFNSQCRIRLEVPEPGMYTLTLHDLLGRDAGQVWQGTVPFERDITFDASDFPSGVYFARAVKSITHRPVATTKLVLLK